MTLTTVIERRLEKYILGINSDLRTQFINELIAKYFKDYSYAMMIKDSYIQLNNYLVGLTPNTIGISKFSINNTNTVLASNSIQFQGFDGVIYVTLSSNIVSITARFDSISKLLRNNLNQALVNRNMLNLKIIEGSKHTEIGYKSRNYVDIDSLDVSKICDYVKDIITVIN